MRQQMRVCILLIVVRTQVYVILTYSMLFKKQNSKIQKQTHTHTHTHKGSGSDFQCCFHDILRHTKPWSKKIEINDEPLDTP